MPGLPRGPGHALPPHHRWAQWLTCAQGAAGRATVPGHKWRTGTIATRNVQREWDPSHSMTPNYYVHQSPYIDAPCSIGAGTKIWHFCHVMAGARIGERCILGQNVHV